VVDATDLYSTYSTRIMDTIKVISLKYTRQYKNISLFRALSVLRLSHS